MLSQALERVSDGIMTEPWETDGGRSASAGITGMKTRTHQSKMTALFSASVN